MDISKHRRTAFISGHTDLSQEDFDRIYVPLLEEAIKNDNAFILGDAQGVDTQALTYLSTPPQQISPGRITIYASKKQNIDHFERQGFNVIGPQDPCLKPTPELEALVGLKKKGKDFARYRHMIKDTHMTLNSDYDILYFRDEEESRAVYGEKYRARKSATEYNSERRVKMQEQKE